jgi:hypothetical protein
MKPAAAYLLAIPALILSAAFAQADDEFDGLNLSMGNLYRTSDAKSRSISPENFTGEKGKAGMSIDGPATNAAKNLGQGWKVSPYVHIQPGKTFTLAEIKGPGCIQQIWMTPTGNFRKSILRFYWDGEDTPSVECPVGDFFACGWGKYAQINSLAICVNPGSAFNCYWQMPFRKKARITMENIDEKRMTLYYQVNYTLTEVPRDAGYFHAQFRQETPLKEKGIYTIVDGIKGKGQYVGTYLAWRVHSPGWWGEGEIKFYMDGDKKFPTICGTGTEDYFCGSYNFENQETKRYQVFTTPYSGLPRCSRRTRFTRSASSSGCIAGTCRTQYGSTKTCASPSRRSAGTRTARICRKKTIRVSGALPTRPTKSSRSCSCPEAGLTKAREARERGRRRRSREAREGREGKTWLNAGVGRRTPLRAEFRH